MNAIVNRVGIKRDDMPWMEDKLDEEFKNFILEFPKSSLPKIYELLDKYHDNKKIKIFKSREEIENYLRSLKC